MEAVFIQSFQKLLPLQSLLVYFMFSLNNKALTLNIWFSEPNIKKKYLNLYKRNTKSDKAWRISSPQPHFWGGKQFSVDIVLNIAAIVLNIKFIFPFIILSSMFKYDYRVILGGQTTQPSVIIRLYCLVSRVRMR